MIQTLMNHPTAPSSLAYLTICFPNHLYRDFPRPAFLATRFSAVLGQTPFRKSLPLVAINTSVCDPAHSGLCAPRCN